MIRNSTDFPGFQGHTRARSVVEERLTAAGYYRLYLIYLYKKEFDNKSKISEVSVLLTVCKPELTFCHAKMTKHNR